MIGGSSPGRGWEFFSSPPRPDRLWDPPSLLSNVYQGALSLGVKRLGREADQLPPSSAEVKNAQSYTSTPQYAFMALCSVKAQGQLYFTFTFIVNCLYETCIVIYWSYCKVNFLFFRRMDGNTSRSESSVAVTHWVPKGQNPISLLFRHIYIHQ
jgi:hypothetical protein